jgi:ABC-type multidrug transport system fused ATPase/permease subunit
VAETVPDEVPSELPAAPALATDGGSAVEQGWRPDGRAPRLRLRQVGARWPRSAAEDAPRPDAASVTVSPSDQPERADLEGMDLDVGPGERVLVEGPSGSGKTTLAHVLVRFLEYEGSYRIGEADARDLDPRDIRRTVGLVEQRPWLFDEDLRQNLLFARATASDDELLEVLDRVGLGEWVAERGGLDARVGERGALVSGGQAQRIALARAMLADFPVLVLDEPTASVDPERADALLRDLLGAAGPERSIVLISHTGAPDGLVDRTVALRG